MKSFGIIIVFIIVLITGLTACTNEPRVIMAPGYESTATEIPQTVLVPGTPVPTAIPPTPTIPPLLSDNDLYALPSQALAFYPPLGWLLQMESPSYAKFISRDNTAWFEVAIETTGYALEEEEYSTYTENLISSLYAGTADFDIIEQITEGLRTTFTSSFI